MSGTSGVKSYRVELHSERFRTKGEAEAFARLRRKSRFDPLQVLPKAAEAKSPHKIEEDFLRNPTHTMMWQELEGVTPKWYCGAEGLTPSSEAFNFEVFSWAELLSFDVEVRFDRESFAPVRSYLVELEDKQYRFRTREEAEEYRETFTMTSPGQRSGKSFSATSAAYKWYQAVSSMIVGVPEEADSQLIWYEGSDLFGSKEGLLPEEGAHTLTVGSLHNSSLDSVILLKRPRAYQVTPPSGMMWSKSVSLTFRTRMEAELCRSHFDLENTDVVGVDCEPTYVLTWRDEAGNSHSTAEGGLPSPDQMVDMCVTRIQVEEGTQPEVGTQPEEAQPEETQPEGGSSSAGWVGAFGVLALLGAMRGRGQGASLLSQASNQEELAEDGEEPSRVEGKDKA